MSSFAWKCEFTIDDCEVLECSSAIERLSEELPLESARPKIICSRFCKRSCNSAAFELLFGLVLLESVLPE